MDLLWNHTGWSSKKIFIYTSILNKWNLIICIFIKLDVLYITSLISGYDRLDSFGSHEKTESHSKFGGDGRGPRGSPTSENPPWTSETTKD